VLRISNFPSMPDFIAQGPQPEHRWRRKLTPGVRQTIGRQAGAWSTPWDDRISRRHADVVYQEGQLQVELFDSARNPAFYRGVAASHFSVPPGEHFVIGQTTFSVVEQRVHVSLDLPRPADERSFSVEELRSRPFHEADKRIDALSRLPEIIRGSASDQELFVRLVNLLLSGIERATAAAVVAVGSQETGVRGQESGEEGFRVQGSGNSQSTIRNPQSELVQVFHWDRRILANADFRPSERLIRQAVACRESVVHVWSGNQARSQGEFTLGEGVDWALCVPISGSACAGWALYITGSFSGDFGPAGAPDAEQLRDDVKFAELTATTLSGLRESRLLAIRQASLSHFFSPVVLEAISNQDPEEVLAPREADVTVLFCDLRGFSRESERSAGDLFGLLARVSQALGIMTRHILAQGGVVGDFHGDAAMGFWGWPIPQPDAVQRACSAALGIRTAFLVGRSGTERPEPESTLPARDAAGIADFRVGIGIASGRAVAGKIGTIDQVKVTVFGPVVNLAARLETMTRQLQASILIDPPTAAIIRASVPATVCRVRRLARVRPVGFASPIEVSELLPPAPTPGEGRGEGSILTDEHLASYEAALAAFESKDWSLALRHLHSVPPDDLAKDFLTLFVARHGRTPPANWDGTIDLERK
jgi:adenylate cyclase